MTEKDGAAPASSARPTLAAATRVWLTIGLTSFGGPAGQIALMHRELVERRGWISNERFLHALNFCMLLPGPEAQQLATYVGWLLHGTRGGLIAGLLFVLPGFLVMLALSAVYAAWQTLPAVAGLFFGLKAAVLAIVVEALIRVGRRALRTRLALGIAAAAFAAIALLGAPFPLVVLCAGLIGFAAARRHPDADPPATESPAGSRPTPGRAVRLIAVFGAAWAAPVAILIALFGPHTVFVPIAAFFSKMAVVTFGGAYAVLAYVAQEAVAGYHWLKPGEMADGLALAETTPGPLILVLVFVGALAGARAAGPLDPAVGLVLGAGLTAWVTFVPCFLWIFLGAPYVERLRGRAALSGALSAITAAVVGVILNLAVWFALHVLFARLAAVAVGPLHLTVPDPASIDVRQAALAILAGALLFGLRAGVVPTLAVTGAAGLLIRSL